jgi:hypothetical protein
MAGDTNLIALGSMATMMPNFNHHHPNHIFGNPAFGGGGGGLDQQPMMQHMNFLGASSPGYHHHAAGGRQQQHGIGHYVYGYGPGFAAVQHHHHHHATTTSAMDGGGSGTPGDRSNEDDCADGGGGGHRGRRARPMSGMTPLVFAGVPANFQGGFQPVLQVVSTDSLGGDDDDRGNGAAPAGRVRMLPMGNHVMVPMQQPKKWVRWSDHEDQVLSRAVEQYGENNFRHVSERIFHGSRTEVQCKNRWKKVRSCASFFSQSSRRFSMPPPPGGRSGFSFRADFTPRAANDGRRPETFQALQPGLVKGRWTKEEDDVIAQSVASGNDKWSEIAKRLPGRIGEQIKERWINVLDPDVKRGIWTEEEMRILRDAQAELGNRWSEIARRIPGRNENSVKNRWYNQKTVRGGECVVSPARCVTLALPNARGRRRCGIVLTPPAIARTPPPHQSDKRSQKKKGEGSSSERDDATPRHRAAGPTMQPRQQRSGDCGESDSDEGEEEDSYIFGQQDNV